MKMQLFFIVCIFFYTQSIPIHQDHSALNLINKATEEYYKQNFSQARIHFEQAAAQEPHNPSLLFNTGLMYAHEQQYDRAIIFYTQALELDPNYIKAYWYRAQALQYLGNFDEALYNYYCALERKPDHYYCIREAAQLHMRIQQYQESLNLYKRICNQTTNEPDIFFEGASCALTQHELETALTWYKKAQELAPSQKEIAYNIAYTLRLMGKDNEAIEYYRETLALDPLHEHAHLGLAKALLASGNFSEGWKEFEWRWHNSLQCIEQLGHHRVTIHGLHNKRILLRAEWGLGDTMQFIRYAQCLKNDGATVFVQIDQALKPLFSLCNYIDKLVVIGESLPEHDIQIPLLSLPFIYNTVESNIPKSIPYLFADTQLVSLWHNILTQDRSFKIGICWQSKPDIFIEDHPSTKRSVPVDYFLSFTDIPGATLYSLQYQHGTEQLESKNHTVHTFSGDFDTEHGRYMDTAAIIMNLDLVITVDTSIVHLAGALGKPVWILLPHVAEWRWMHERSDTPWYPNARLFRQPKAGDWQTVFNTLHQELINLIAQRNS